MQYIKWNNHRRLPSSKLVLLFLIFVVLRLQGNELFDGIQGSEDFEPTQDPAIIIDESEHSAELIPDKTNLLYKLQGQAKSISSGGFAPYHDAPAFINFHSVATDYNNVRRYAPGTCHGVSYVTAMWYAGIYKPLLEIKPSLKDAELQFVGQRDLIFGERYDGPNQICKESKSNALSCNEDDKFITKLSQRMDGITYLASMAKVSDPQFFNKCGPNLKNCRLYEVSKNSNLNPVVKQTMAHHQNQQQIIKDIDIEVNKPSKLRAQIYEVRKRIEKYGTVLFYWYIYSNSESWSGSDDADSDSSEEKWDQFEAGHSMLLYKVSEVKVTVSGQSKQALKLHIYDPNIIYRNLKLIDSAEGFGSYLLFFPDTGLITFSNAKQKFYSGQTDFTQGDSENIAKGLQGGFASIDGKQTIIGFSDFYEGHESQFNDATDIFTFAQSFEADERDQNWFHSFVQYESCDEITSRVNKLKSSKDPKAQKLFTDFRAWFNKNNEAVQTHLRAYEVIDVGETCNPFS